jgi:hypothetical protein
MKQFGTPVVATMSPEGAATPFFEQHKPGIEKTLRHYALDASVSDGLHGVLEAIRSRLDGPAPERYEPSRDREYFRQLGLTSRNMLSPLGQRVPFDKVVVLADTVVHSNAAVHSVRSIFDASTDNPRYTPEVLLLGSDRPLVWGKSPTTLLSAVRNMHKAAPHDGWAQYTHQLALEGTDDAIQALRDDEINSETMGLRMAALTYLQPLSGGGFERRTNDQRGDAYRYDFERGDTPITLMHASANNPDAYQQQLIDNVAEWSVRRVLDLDTHDSVLVLAANPRRLRVARLVALEFAKRGWQGEVTMRGPRASQQLPWRAYMEEVYGNLHIDQALEAKQSPKA